MKRYILFFIVLLVVEQLAQTLISTFVPSDLVTRWRWGDLFLRFGSQYNPDGPIRGLAVQVYFLVPIILYGLTAHLYLAMRGRRDWLFRALALSTTLLIFQMANQSIDFGLRGYVIDYFGYGSYSPTLHSVQMHSGDVAMFIAYGLGYVSVFCAMVWAAGQEFRYALNSWRVFVLRNNFVEGEIVE